MFLVIMARRNLRIRFKIAMGYCASPLSEPNRVQPTCGTKHKNVCESPVVAPCMQIESLHFAALWLIVQLSQYLYISKSI